MIMSKWRNFYTLLQFEKGLNYVQTEETRLALKTLKIFSSFLVFFSFLVQGQEPTASGHSAFSQKFQSITNVSLKSLKPHDFFQSASTRLFFPNFDVWNVSLTNYKKNVKVPIKGGGDLSSS